MDQIDWIQRAHAQKHVPGRGGWAKPSDLGRKPWFCKSYQTGISTYSRNHESNGKLQKHICTYCLMGGRQLTQTEKDGAAAKLCWVGVLLKAVRPLLAEKG